MYSTSHRGGIQPYVDHLEVAQANEMLLLKVAMSRQNSARVFSNQSLCIREALIGVRKQSCSGGRN